MIYYAFVLCVLFVSGIQSSSLPEEPSFHKSFHHEQQYHGSGQAVGSGHSGSPQQDQSVAEQGIAGINQGSHEGGPGVPAQQPYPFVPQTKPGEVPFVGARAFGGVAAPVAPVVPAPYYQPYYSKSAYSSGAQYNQLPYTGFPYAGYQYPGYPYPAYPYPQQQYSPQAYSAGSGSSGQYSTYPSYSPYGYGYVPYYPGYYQPSAPVVGAVESQSANKQQ